MGVHNCLGAAFQPPVQKPPPPTHTPRDKDLDGWIRYQEQLSPFLNDEKLNNGGGKSWGFTQAWMPIPNIPLSQKEGAGRGRYHTRNIFALFSVMKPSTHGWRILWGEGDVMIRCPIPKTPKFRDKDVEREIHYWEWFCPFLDDILDETGEDLGLHGGGCSIPNLPNPTTRAGTLGYVTGEGSAPSRMTKHSLTG